MHALREATTEIAERPRNQPTAIWAIFKEASEG